MLTRATSRAPFGCCPRCSAILVRVLRFAGEVVTVKCFEDNSLVKAAVDSAGLRPGAGG